jgi:hypothetical protein
VSIAASRTFAPVAASWMVVSAMEVGDESEELRRPLLLDRCAARSRQK